MQLPSNREYYYIVQLVEAAGVQLGISPVLSQGTPRHGKAMISTFKSSVG